MRNLFQNEDLDSRIRGNDNIKNNIAESDYILNEELGLLSPRPLSRGLNGQ
jgi:hypothetical protein